MQILIVTLGSIGDLMPFLAAAEALRARGHDCIIASNAGYAPIVRSAGFPFAVIWERGSQNLDAVLARDPAEAWNNVRQEMFEPAIEPTLAFIRDFAKRSPSTVLASWSALGAARARTQIGVKLAIGWLSPLPLAQELEAGASDVDIALFPAWFAPAPSSAVQTGFPLFPDALVPPLPLPLEEFLRGGPAPVIFTPGSFMRQARPFFEAGLAACARLKLRAILLTPYADQLPPLPTHVRHYPYIPLQRLAPRAAAIVHHGGIGTAAQGLRAGIPQLLAPVFYDQADNAARLERLGVGRRLIDAHDGEEMTAALEAMLAAQVREQSRSMREHFGKGDPLAAICDTVESLT